MLGRRIAEIEHVNISNDNIIRVNSQFTSIIFPSSELAAKPLNLPNTFVNPIVIALKCEIGSFFYTAA